MVDRSARASSKTHRRVRNYRDNRRRRAHPVPMRSVHLTHLSENPQRAAYLPTPHAGAPLIVEFVPDAVSDQEVARLASVTTAPVALGRRHVVAFHALKRRQTGH
jgi:hypothetical protein